MKYQSKKKHSTQGWVAIALSGFVGSTIATFLRGGIVSMPVDFPYSRGWWNVIGVTTIMLAYFLIGLIITLIVKSIKNRPSNFM